MTFMAPTKIKVGDVVKLHEESFACLMLNEPILFKNVTSEDRWTIERIVPYQYSDYFFVALKNNLCLKEDGTYLKIKIKCFENVHNDIIFCYFENRYKLIVFEKNLDVIVDSSYCSCISPKLKKNVASFKFFDVCTTCHKERK